MDFATLILICIPVFACTVVVLDDRISQQAMKREARARLQS